MPGRGRHGVAIPTIGLTAVDLFACTDPASGCRDL